MEYKLKIVTWNANGILNKLDQLKLFLFKHKVDIMLINESKLIKTDGLRIKNYSILRSDRNSNDNVRGGGVLILIKNNVPYKKINSPKTDIENTILKLENGILLIAAYNRPSNIMSTNDLDKLFAINNKTLIIGDLNACHTLWNNNRNNTNGNTINNYANNNNINIHFTDNPTHYPNNNSTPSTIDIVLNKNVNNVSKPISLPELNSDHNPVALTINGKRENHTKTIRSYKNTNWAKFRSDLNNVITINNKIDSTTIIEKEVETLTQNIMLTINRHSTKKTIDPHKEYIPEVICNLIKEKNKTRKRYQTSADPALKTILTQLNVDIKNAIKTHRNTNWSEKLKNLSPSDNSLWKTVKYFKKPLVGIPEIHHNNITAVTDNKKANALGEMFASINKLDLSNSTAKQLEITETINKFIQETFTIKKRDAAKLITSPEEIIAIIKKMPASKAPGADKLENKIIKNLPRKAIIQLTYIINGILMLQYWPNNWKNSIVIPIIKPNKNPTQTTSYRPISLLPGLSKIAEKVILKRLNLIDEKIKFTPDEQFGFRSKHSTVQQVLRITDNIITQFNHKKDTVMILLDIEKAFDRVWIDGVIFKLMKLNFPNHIIKLLHSYLTGRNFNVKINNSLSDNYSTHAGVPQGTVLGPKIFTMYMHDLPKFQKTNMAIYADDTAIYSHSFSAEVAARQLQIHLKILENYYDLWRIKINPQKTELITFTRKYTNNTIYSPIKINDQLIQQKKCVKYLGVQLDSRLNFNSHIKLTTQRAYGALKTMYPLLKNNNGVTARNKKLIYTGLIRPILTYAAPIWGGASQRSLKCLEVFQNKCLRLITHSDRYTRIRDMYQETNLNSLSTFIKELSENFYKSQLDIETLKHISKRNKNNISFVMKHKLPYHNISFFNHSL